MAGRQIVETTEHDASSPAVEAVGAQSEPLRANPCTRRRSSHFSTSTGRSPSNTPTLPVAVDPAKLDACRAAPL